MLTPAQEILRFGRFALNPNTASLNCAGEERPLRPKSFDVLLYLARNRGRVVSKDELMQSVWPEVFVTDNSLVQCISEIRDALGEEAQAVLKTVPRRGYLFAASIDVVAVSPASESAAAPDYDTVAATARRPATVYLAIAGVAALVAGGGWWVSQNRTLPDNPATQDFRSAGVSIAVLPFVTVGVTAADEYFARGLTEDIVVALSLLRPVGVLREGGRPL